MKQPIWFCVCALVLAVSVMADDDGGRSVGTVSAVYHEGIVSFAVEHPRAVSMQVRVFDTATEGLVFDSGPRRGVRVEWPVGRDSDGSWRYVVTAWSMEGEVVVSQTAVSDRQDEISAIPFDTIPAGTKLYGPGDAIGLQGDVEFGLPVVGSIQEWSGDGGRLEINDDVGNAVTYLQADTNGSGGYLGVLRNSSSIGFRVDGNSSGTYEPEVTISGASRSAVFDMGTSGDGSVELPVDAIASDEIFDEAGIASVRATEVTLSGSSYGVISQTITLPDWGKLVAIASTVFEFKADSNLHTTIEYALNVDSTLMPSWHNEVMVPPNHLGDSVIYFPVTALRVFSLGPGEYTVNFVVDRNFADEAVAQRPYMALIYIPTAYGWNAEDPGKSLADGSWLDQEEPMPGPSAEDIAAERERSIAANQARIDGEMAAMRERVEALEMELAAER